MPRIAESKTTFQELHPGSIKLYQTVKEFCATSGLSCKMIREGCKSGKIPHIRVGEGENARFMINAKLALEQLDQESRKEM